MGDTLKGKRLAFLLGVVMIASIGLAACMGTDKSGGPGENVGAAQKLHILLSHTNAKYAMQVKDDDVYIKELSRLSNVQLQFEFLGHGSDFTQQLTVRFASGELPDLIRTDSINSSMHPGAVDKGVFEDLTPLIEKFGPNLLKKIPAEAWKSPRVSRDGKIYGIPTLSALPASRVVYIRQDWLDKLNMKAPSTIDEWLAYFEAVKREDVNGNGDPNDEYGFYVRENLIYSNLFFNEFGADPGVWTYRDGKLEPGSIQPQVLEASVR